MIAVLLAVFRFFPLSKVLTPAKITIASFIVLLVLPWSEGLGLSFEGAGEDWSRILFWQALFLYLLTLFFDIFPGIAGSAAKSVQTLLTHLSSKQVLLWLPPLLFYVLSLWITLGIYQSTPLVEDSAAHLFQAKIFKASKLVAPEPSAPDFFSQKGDMLAMKDGKWFGMYQPGFALLLAAAMFLKAEWFVSPFLGAITIAIWIAYCRRWHGLRTALLFGIVALTSPFLLVMSSTVMVHTPELFIASALIYLCRNESDEPSSVRPLLVFLLLATGMLVRGFSLLAFLFPALIYTTWLLFQRRKFLFPLMAAGGIAAGMLLLAYYQSHVTGSPFTPGYVIEYPELRYGFGSSLAGQVHTPLRGLENTSNNFLGINLWLNGWYSGSLIFILLFLLLERRFQNWDLVLFAGIFSLILFYYFYVAQTLVLGPRSYYILAPVLIVFLIRSIQIESDLSKYSIVAISIFVVSLVSSLPSRVPGLIQQWNPAGYQAGFLKREMDASGNQKLLVFLTNKVSQSFINWNGPFLKGNLIICRDLESRNREAIAQFQNHRPVYFTANAGLKGGFSFHDSPEQRPNGFLSSFDLTMSLQAGRDYPDKDSFDICYTDLFQLSSASLHLLYVQKELSQGSADKTYKDKFKGGVLHAGRLLLLPLVAQEEAGDQWWTIFNPDVFRAEFHTTLKLLSESEEVGKTITEQLLKVKKRIDQNSDGSLSDDEIRKFLSKKLKLMEVR